MGLIYTQHLYTHLPLMSGGGRYICLSNLPGRNRAGSRTSGRLVPAKTTTLVVVLNPIAIYYMYNIHKYILTYIHIYNHMYVHTYTHVYINT